MLFVCNGGHRAWAGTALRLNGIDRLHHAGADVRDTLTKDTGHGEHNRHLVVLQFERMRLEAR